MTSAWTVTLTHQCISCPTQRSLVELSNAPERWFSVALSNNLLTTVLKNIVEILFLLIKYHILKYVYVFYCREKNTLVVMIRKMATLIF